MRYADEFWGNDSQDSGYNPVFHNYNEEGGYDCTNFLSQIMIAGNITFRNAAGIVDDRGAMIRVNEIGEELVARHGVTSTQDYDHTLLPLSLRKADPVFLVDTVPLLRYALDSKEHATVIVGAEQNLLRYNAHFANRHHEPYTTFQLSNYWEIYKEVLRHMTMPDAPIIKFMELSVNDGTDSHVVSRWKYDSNYDPTLPRYDYYFHTYDGLTPTSLDLNDNLSSVGQGELRLKVIFDTTMRQSDIMVKSGRNAPAYDEFQFETIAWSATHQFSDTWEGRAIVPENMDGVHHISVVAFAPDGSQLDSDANLSTYSPGPDTRLTFTIGKGKSKQVDDCYGSPKTEIHVNECVCARATNPLGICSIECAGNNVPIPGPNRTSVIVGPYCPGAPGQYSCVFRYCGGGGEESININVVDGYSEVKLLANGNPLMTSNVDTTLISKDELTLTIEDAGLGLSQTELAALSVQMGVIGISTPFGVPTEVICYSGNCSIRASLKGPPISLNFWVENKLENPVGKTFSGNIAVSASMFPNTNVMMSTLVNYSAEKPWERGANFSGSLTVPLTSDMSSRQCEITSTGEFCINSPIPGLNVSCRQADNADKALAEGQNKVPSSMICEVKGSAVAFTPALVPPKLSFSYTPDPESGTDLETLAIYRFDGSAWEPASITNQNRAIDGNGVILITGDTFVGGIFAPLFDLPPTLPDATAPAISDARVSDDGIFWRTPDALLSGSTVWASVTVSDPPFSVQLISGLSTTTAAVPLTAVEGTHSLIHFDEGTGSIAADSSGNNAFATPTRATWGAGRFSNAILLDPANSAYAGFGSGNVAVFNTAMRSCSIRPTAPTRVSAAATSLSSTPIPSRPVSG